MSIRAVYTPYTAPSSPHQPFPSTSNLNSTPNVLADLSMNYSRSGSYTATIDGGDLKERKYPPRPRIRDVARLTCDFVDGWWHPTPLGKFFVPSRQQLRLGEHHPQHPDEPFHSLVIVPVHQLAPPSSIAVRRLHAPILLEHHFASPCAAATVRTGFPVR